MSLARKFAVVVLAVLLTTTLVTANVVAAAHLTVLDPDFVTSSMEEEGGYGLVETATQEAAANAVPANDTGPVDANALLADAVSTEYIAAQTEANVDRTYAYLHGDRDTVNVSIATAPIRENVSDGVERQLRNASVVELLRHSEAELDGPVNASMIERMTANESSYRATQADVREQVRDRVLDSAVNESFEEADNDELLALVVEDYDPRDYSEAEKRRMVDDREAEIRVALRERIEDERGEEIDAAVEEQLRTLRQNATVDPNQAESAAEAAGMKIQNTVVRGLTTDTSYRTFQSDLSEAKAELASAAAAETDTRLAAEMPDRVDLTENASGAEMERFEQARTGVKWLDRLAFVVPAVALGLVGLLYSVRRSVAAVATDTGVSLLAAGVPAVVGVELARSRLQSMAAEAPAAEQAMIELAVGLAGRVLGTVGGVALAFTAAGVLLVAGSLAVRYGLLETLQERLNDGDGDRGMI
jgi:hypothetical protein